MFLSMKLADCIPCNNLQAVHSDAASGVLALFEVGGVTATVISADRSSIEITCPGDQDTCSALALAADGTALLWGTQNGKLFRVVLRESSFEPVHLPIPSECTVAGSIQCITRNDVDKVYGVAFAE